MNVSVLRNSSHSEPRSLLAGALAVLVHLIFVAMLIFGLNWKDHPPEGMVVDIWAELPQPTREPVKTVTPPKQESKAVQEPVKPKPEPPKPEPPPEPVKSEPLKPAPQKAVTTPLVKKPDIALKQKPEPIKEDKPDLQEQKKKEQEKVKEQEKIKELEKQKELEKKKELEKQKELEKKKALEKQKELDKQKELEKQKELQKQKEKEQAIQRQREQEAKAQREAEAKRAAQQAAARNLVTNEVSKYKALILAKIRSRIVMPPDLPGNPVAEFNVTLLPGGDILDVRLSKSSGHAAFDSAVERAIFLSKPLPLPPDPALFGEFRNLNIKVHYRE
ncbi:MAG: cell envelope integrity protein TolA [Nitrosomonas sp.]|nr:cell envelope integrity protein TolA [Nitrosomonas sp.]MBP7112210.1 cell envelope integrity protein TolA [Nitrosomonas sp.]